MDQKTAERFMRLAIEQAKKGRHRTFPNPLVGCVIVKDKNVISSGFHQRFGGPHAEVLALKKAGKKAKGAVLFVTLEPCSYHGKTPPCTDIIIKSGIKELICACNDPNPLNNGKGIRALRAAGLKVTCGLLQEQAKRLNPDFIKRMKAKRPFVTLKLAQSMDGKIATRKNDSKWISSEKSRGFVQVLRKGHDAVMVGINTVLYDDPLLTIRNKAKSCPQKTRQPVKIIVDSTLKTPARSRVLSGLSPGTTIIATAQEASAGREKALREKGVDIIRVSRDKRGINLTALMKSLVEKGINSVLLEGGGELAASMLEVELVDRVYFFISPIIIGGRDSVNSVAGAGADKISNAVKLFNIETKRIDKDILVKADVHRNR
jgi:diaminohydroxyphosphoribosylaminopyrimidine deaminase / 5-amino-6-(5-phosphoribosylamino)uracil reductase